MSDSENSINTIAPIVMGPSAEVRLPSPPPPDIIVPSTPASDLKESLKLAQDVASKHSISMPRSTPLDQSVLRLVKNAKYTLDSSTYTHVASKRVQLEGIKELETAYHSLSNDFTTLYQAYNDLLLNHKKLLSELERIVPEATEAEQLMRKKQDEILAILEVTTLDAFNNAVARRLNLDD